MSILGVHPFLPVPQQNAADDGFPVAAWAHWDFTDATTITGDPITAVTDKSGNSRALEDHPTSSPDVGTGGQNSLQFADYSAGSASLITASTQTLEQDFTILIVFETEATTQTTRLVLCADSIDQTYAMVNSSHIMRLRAGSNANAFGVTTADSTFTVVIAEFSGTSSKSQMWNADDSFAFEEVTSLDPGTNDLVTAQDIAVGRYHSSATTFGGKMYEVALFDSVLSDSDKNDILTYLDSKYNITTGKIP